MLYRPRRWRRGERVLLYFASLLVTLARIILLLAQRAFRHGFIELRGVGYAVRTSGRIRMVAWGIVRRTRKVR